MTIDLDAGQQSAASQGASVARRPVIAWLALAGLFAIALILRHVLAANTDVSWLLTAGERVLGGGKLYVDVIETNPPMAVLAYLPALLIGRATGWPPEIIVDALVFLAIAASLACCAIVLRRNPWFAGASSWPLLLLAFGCLAILPAGAFGQREHIALIATLPALAVLILRIAGDAPPRLLAIIAGLGVAAAFSFKPHLVLAFYSALSLVAMMTRMSWRVLRLPEHLAAVAGAVAYVALTAWLWPQYFTDILPLVGDVYVPVKLSVMELLEKPAVSFWAIALLATVGLQRGRSVDPPLLVLMAASSGFASAFALPMKGWPYQSYPMIALALFSLGYAIVRDNGSSRLWRMAAGLLLFAVFLRAMLWFDSAFDALPLQRRVAQLGQNKPAILAITAEPGIGHPLTRAVGGTWVSRQQGLWVETYLNFMRRNGTVSAMRVAELDAYAVRERQMLIEDIHRTPPSIVLVDDLTGTASEWLQAHPDVAVLLADYRVVDTVNKVAILTRGASGR